MNVTRNCEQCGEIFEAKREHARFCSAYCRVTWNRANPAGEAPNANVEGEPARAVAHERIRSHADHARAGLAKRAETLPDIEIPWNPDNFAELIATWVVEALYTRLTLQSAEGRLWLPDSDEGARVMVVGMKSSIREHMDAIQKVIWTEALETDTRNGGPDRSTVGLIAQIGEHADRLTKRSAESFIVSAKVDERDERRQVLDRLKIALDEMQEWVESAEQSDPD